jgi:hypothetical protein
LNLRPTCDESVVERLVDCANERIDWTILAGASRGLRTPVSNLINRAA